MLIYIEHGCSGAMKHTDVREWPIVNSPFSSTFTYMDVGKGREQGSGSFALLSTFLLSVQSTQTITIDKIISNAN